MSSEVAVVTDCCVYCTWASILQVNLIGVGGRKGVHAFMCTIRLCHWLMGRFVGAPYGERVISRGHAFEQPADLLGEVCLHG